MSSRTSTTKQKAPAMRALPALLLLAANLALPGAPARAAITDFDLFKDVEYLQNSNALPTTPLGTFFSSRVFYDTAGDLGAVSTTFSGPGSPLTPYISQPGDFLFQTGFLTQAQLDAKYPFGAPYTFTISGGTLGTRMATLATPSATYYPATPFLTGNSYTQLQGLNAALADTITFNGFTPVTGASDPGTGIYLTITRQSDNSVVYSQSDLAPSTTSILLAANTLAANTAYNIDLDYSSRINTPSAGFGNALGVVGFDQRTEITFTTAPLATVPEPASLALTAIGVASAVLALRKRRPKSSP